MYYFAFIWKARDTESWRIREEYLPPAGLVLDSLIGGGSMQGGSIDPFHFSNFSESYGLNSQPPMITIKYTTILLTHVYIVPFIKFSIYIG